MTVDDALLDEIVRRILAFCRPDKIILFGSAATGEMTVDSDIDLLVVEPDPPKTLQYRVDLWSAVGDVGYPLDLKVIQTERFEETKELIGGIAFPANKYGRVLYESA